MGNRNRFFNFRSRRQNNRFEQPALEPLQQGGTEFKQGRFPKLFGTEERRARTGAVFAAVGQAFSPNAPLSNLASGITQGRSADILRKNRFASFESGVLSNASTFGLSAEQVGQIERDVTNRFQFEQAAQAQVTQTEDLIKSREAISNANRIAAQTRIDSQIDALKDSREAQAENSRVQAELAGLRIDQIKFPDIGLKAQELALQIDANSDGFLGYSEALFQAYTQLEVQGRVPKGTTDKLFPGRILEITDKEVTEVEEDEKDKAIKKLSPSELLEQARSKAEEAGAGPTPSRLHRTRELRKRAFELAGATIGIRPGLDPSLEFDALGRIGAPVITGISREEKDIISNFTLDQLIQFVQEESRKRSVR